MCDRIAVMNRGRIEQVGSPDGHLRAPGDALRRRFRRPRQHPAGDPRRRRAASLSGARRCRSRPRRPARSTSSSGRSASAWSRVSEPVGRRRGAHPRPRRAQRLRRRPDRDHGRGRRRPAQRRDAVRRSARRPKARRSRRSGRPRTRCCSRARRHDDSAAPAAALLVLPAALFAARRLCLADARPVPHRLQRGRRRPARWSRPGRCRPRARCSPIRFTFELTLNSLWLSLTATALALAAVPIRSRCSCSAPSRASAACWP